MHSLLKVFFVALVLHSTQFLGAEGQKSKSICLNMIVKNESQVITRCLDSVLPLIDYWVIVDTGSTDGTQKIIKDYMALKGVPGDLHERPWVNFGHNRTEAIKLADGKADYLLFIDADEYLVYDRDFALPVLDKDYYYITISHTGSSYSRIQLVNNHQDWSYVGVLHEVICPPAYRTSAPLEKVKNIYTTEGARSKDPDKYLKDAQIFEEALKLEPNNDRYAFYLAQSYQDARKYDLALQNYQKRAVRGGWDQEVFWCLYRIAALQELLEMPDAVVLNSFNKAFKYRSSRIEPLYHIVLHHRRKNDFISGYFVAKRALEVPKPNDLLFVQSWMYDYGMPLELSVCAYWIGCYEECQEISQKLLKRTDLPENIRECIESNLRFADEKIRELGLQKAA